VQLASSAAGFIPFSRLDPSRLEASNTQAAAEDSRADLSLDETKRSSMIGQPVKAKVIQVRAPAWTAAAAGLWGIGLRARSFESVNATA